MKESTRSEIERIIGNRHTEAHPFKSGGAGLEWFARMTPLVAELSAEELHTFLVPLMDRLLANVDDCYSCRAKCLVYAEALCSSKGQKDAERYGEQYRLHMLNKREDSEPSDYRAEVREAIARYGNPPGQ